MMTDSDQVARRARHDAILEEVAVEKPRLPRLKRSRRTVRWMCRCTCASTES